MMLGRDPCPGPVAMSLPPDVDVPRDFEDLRGRVFHQRYAVTELLSAGRCHVVYGATDRKGAGQVLLRVMRPTLLKDRPTLARFEQRVQAARRASSLRARPSIDAGEARDGKLFLVCKRPPGRSLRQYVAEHEHGRLPWPVAEALLRSLVEVLAAAHDRRIVHGGMMPDSFWLEEADGAAPVAYVVDLGANPEVRLDGGAGEESRTTALTADMEFSAPETIRSNTYDPRTDVYLLGLIAWFMLTGAPPFQGKNHYQVASMQLQQALPQLRGVVPGISEEVEALIERMLAKDPAARPQTMGEVGRELAAVGEVGVKGREGGAGVSARAGVTPAGLGVRASVMGQDAVMPVGPAVGRGPVRSVAPAVAHVPVVTPAPVMPAAAAVSRAPVMPTSAARPPAAVTRAASGMAPTMGEVPTIPRTSPTAARVEPTEILGVRREGPVEDVSATMVLRDREATADVERTTAFVARPAASAREATVVQAPVEDHAADERTLVHRVEQISPTVEPPEAAQELTSPLVQSGLTAVVSRSDLEPAAPVPTAPPVPVATWTPEPVAPAPWLPPEQLHHSGPVAPVPFSQSTMHGRVARRPAGVTLPVVWVIVAFMATITAGVALGVWLAG